MHADFLEFVGQQPHDECQGGWFDKALNLLGKAAALNNLERKGLVTRRIDPAELLERR